MKYGIFLNFEEFYERLLMKINKMFKIFILLDIIS